LDQLSVRALAERHEVHRRTVRQALDSALPPPRKAYPRPAPAIGPWTEVIDSWLEYERVPRKQRHTARRKVYRYPGTGPGYVATAGAATSSDTPGL
jgi:hypothetical protein